MKKSTFGVKEDSAFNSLVYAHATTIMGTDISHDFSHGSFSSFLPPSSTFSFRNITGVFEADLAGVHETKTLLP